MKKVLLMGPSKSGKTSMRGVIFANFLPHDTSRLLATTEVERSQAKFLGNLVLNLWDCGGQYDFIEKYLDQQKDVIFSNVAVLVYVFDLASLTQEKETAEQKWTKKRSYEYFANSVSRLLTYSSNARVFCFLHKVDVFPTDKREAVCDRAKKEILPYLADVPQAPIEFFETSLWEPSLYRAWNTVICHLIPHREILRYNLTQIRSALQCPYAAILDRSTLLCIEESYDDAVPSPVDITVFAGRLKRLKAALVGGKAPQWGSIEMKTPGGIGVVAEFTKQTFIIAMRATTVGADVAGCRECPTLVRKNLECSATAFRAFLEESRDLVLIQDILGGTERTR